MVDIPRISITVASEGGSKLHNREFGEFVPYILGTAIPIYVLLDDTTALTTCKITIYDSYETRRVNAASMTKEADSVYGYGFQTDEDWNEGRYICVVEAVLGSYSVIEEFYINLIDQIVE